MLVVVLSLFRSYMLYDGRMQCHKYANTSGKLKTIKRGRRYRARDTIRSSLVVVYSLEEVPEGLLSTRMTPSWLHIATSEPLGVYIYEKDSMCKQCAQGTKQL